MNNTPIVQAANSIVALMDQANAHADATEQNSRLTLESAYKCGLALLEAKIAAGRGNFGAVLKDRWKHSRELATQCLRIAHHWKEVSGAVSIREALRWLAEAADESEVMPNEQIGSATNLPKSGGGQSSTGSAGQPGERADSGSKRTPGTATSPPPVQPTLDFTGESAILKRTQAAIARKKKLAQEAHAALGQLLEVLPELSTGTMGPEFAELATAAGLGPVPHKSEKGEFVGPKLVTEEKFTDRFPPLEALREATATFLKKFGSESDAARA